MERKIECFEWQYHAGDYIDGTLESVEKSMGDLHLSQCKECSSRLEHYQWIVSSVERLPKQELPPQIAKTQMAKAFKRFDWSRFKVSRWDRLPWYFRVGVETLGIVIVILVGISSGPKIRNLYEKKIDRNLNDFKENPNSPDPNDPLIEEAGLTNALPGAALGTQVAQNIHTGTDNFTDDGENEEEADEGRPSVSEDISSGKDLAANTKLWHFSLKSVSPDEIRPLVVSTLLKLGIPTTTEGIQGTLVPGGIEFDFFLTPTLIPTLKTELQKLAPADKKAAPGLLGMTDSFSWYRMKSKKKIPPGKSQVVIWISQLN